MADDNDHQLQPLKYNNPGLRVDLGVGLWAWPLPLDYDQDGDLDLVVSCTDVPYNGLYLFENPGQSEDKLPVFKSAKRLGPGLRNATVSFHQDRPRVLVPGAEIQGFPSSDATQKEIYPRTTLIEGGRVRANQWSYVDFDGDEVLDIVVGHGFWGDYGWDNAFDANGRWTNGPLRGFVYVLSNRGTNDNPEYAEPVQLQAGGAPIDVFGMPSPNFADFDGDGDLDLICGEFIDGFTWFENVGSRKQPRYAAGRELMLGDQPLKMHLCMIVVVGVDWDHDGDTDLVVGQEDGRIALIEHTGQVDESRGNMPVFAEPRFFQQEADQVKFGALVTPVGFDWDGDGDEDIVAGNTAGEVGFIENLDGGIPPKWNKPKLLEADGMPIRIMAGQNGSIQGPAESKWGYTTLDVADWDQDGLPDIVVNSIWGKVVWYRNIGTRTKPKLSSAAPIRVDWPGQPPKPSWNWWNPVDGELASQWRTTPVVVDWDQDGLNDLVMLDHEGYLAFFQRERRGERLFLKPGQRIFGGGSYNRNQELVDPKGPLRLNDAQAGQSGRRKLSIVDFDGDGRRDLLVNARNVHVMRNVPLEDGSISFEDAGPVDTRRLAGHTTSPTTVDWNRDGVRDLLIGAEDGFLYYMENPHP